MPFATKTRELYCVTFLLLHLPLFVSCNNDNMLPDTSRKHEDSKTLLTNPDGIALYLIQDHSRALTYSSEFLNPSFRKMVPLVVAWGNGKVLYGEKSDKTNEYIFFYGNTGAFIIQCHAAKIWRDFNLKKKDILINDYGLDASCFCLYVNNNDNTLFVTTWEEYARSDLFPLEIIFDKTTTQNNRPIYLPEFYDIWNDVKRNLLCHKELTNEKRNFLQVDVTLELGHLTVWNKSGDIIVNQRISLCPIDAPKSDELTPKPEQK